MKHLTKKSKTYRAKIIKKYGSIKRFAKLTGKDEVELLADLTINLSEESLAKVESLFQGTSKETPANEITEALKVELNKRVLEHPDSKNEKLRVSYQEFFRKNPTWTNTYFSEVMNGARVRITNKLQLLCIKLEIEIKDFI